jgi:hypothetical protein
VEGKEDITIKISDEGGGIPRSAIPLIWTYMYTTMEQQGLDQDFQASDFKAPMAGFGYGLPLSRLVSGFSWIGGVGFSVVEGFGFAWEWRRLPTITGLSETIPSLAPTRSYVLLLGRADE